MSLYFFKTCSVSVILSSSTDEKKGRMDDVGISIRLSIWVFVCLERIRGLRGTEVYEEFSSLLFSSVHCNFSLIFYLFF